MLAAKFWPKNITPRPEQVALTAEVVTHYATTDVFVFRVSTAGGKGPMQAALANWRAACGEDVTLTSPTNILVAQQAKYGGAELYGKEHYIDVDASRAALAACKASRIRVMNAHTMAAYKIQTPVVMLDEAHTLIDSFGDSKDVRFDRSTYDFPTDLARLEDVVSWIQWWMRANPGHVGYERIRRGLHEILLMEGGATVAYHERLHRKPDLILHIMAHGARSVSQWVLPPHKVRKVFLFSATINEQDVAELGLAGRRVRYLTCPSPIDPVRRPLIYEPVVHMGAKYRKHAMPKFAARLRQLLAERPENGIVHMTYETAKMLKALMPNEPRLMWHNNKNKAKILGDFRRAAGSGAVLVASGLYEGVDLIEDIARWQVLGHVPYPSLADARTRERATADPAWYAWGTIKSLVQAYGRVCRSPTDSGDSYIFDVQFERLLREHRSLFPTFFLEALVGQAKKI